MSAQRVRRDPGPQVVQEAGTSSGSAVNLRGDGDQQVCWGRREDRRPGWVLEPPVVDSELQQVVEGKVQI